MRYAPMFALGPLFAFLVMTGCGGGSSKTPAVPPAPPTANPTPQELDRTMAMTRTLASMGSVLSTPGGMPLLATERGPVPVMLPGVGGAAAAMACPLVTNGGDGRSMRLDFNGCAGMRGVIQVAFTLSGETVHETITYEGFGYTTTFNGSAHGASLNGTLTVDGSVQASAAGMTCAWRIQAPGLSCVLQMGDVQESWNQELDLNARMVSSPGRMQLTEWGTVRYTSALGTYAATVAKESPLAWELPTCPTPLSGTVNWLANGKSVKAVFGPSCGMASFNGASVKF